MWVKGGAECKEWGLLDHFYTYAKKMPKDLLKVPLSSHRTY
jgi:hypothetical protein